MNEKISDKEFNQIMSNAIQIKKGQPTLEADVIALIVCTPYMNHDTYEELLFQITMNVVNLDR